MPDLEICDGLTADGPTAAPGRGYHAPAFSHTHTAPGGLPLQTPRETADQSFGGQAVELFSLVSFLALLVVGTTVGSRLLLLARHTRKLPEFAIGTACLGTALGGVFLCPILYFAGSWPEGTVFASVIASSVVNGVAGSAICLLTWRVFRPGRLWAASAWAAASLALLAAVVGAILRGDVVPHWALRPENHLFMWVRVSAFLWAGFESLRYAGMMRRQARVGLGNPVVAAQIRLWGVAAVAISLMLVFWALAPHLGHASVQDWSAGMFAANTLGLVGAGSLHLAFLSPEAWRRWIAERAAS